MSPGTWLIFIGTGLVTAFSPGPAVALAVARTLSLGPRAACISSAGNVVGVLVVGLLCASALRVLALEGGVLSLLRLLGGAYLIYMGLAAIRDSRQRAAAIGESPAVPQRAADFSRGMAVALLNPKSYVFFAAVLPQVTAAPGSALATLWPKVVAFAACTAASHAFYIGACASLRISAAAALAIARVCGVATAALGLGFVLADLTPYLSN